MSNKNVEIGVLLEKVENLEQRVDDHIAENSRKLTNLEHTVSELVVLVSRYKGFIGGMLFVFSCIGAAFAMFIEYFKGVK